MSKYYLDENQTEGQKKVQALAGTKFDSLKDVQGCFKDIKDHLTTALKEDACSLIESLEASIATALRTNQTIDDAGRCFTKRFKVGPVRECFDHDAKNLEETAGHLISLADELASLPIPRNALLNKQMTVEELCGKLTADANQILGTLQDPQVAAYTDHVRNAGVTHNANFVAKYSNNPCTGRDRC